MSAKRVIEDEEKDSLSARIGKILVPQLGTLAQMATVFLEIPRINAIKDNIIRATEHGVKNKINWQVQTLKILLKKLNLLAETEDAFNRAISPIEKAVEELCEAVRLYAGETFTLQLKAVPSSLEIFDFILKEAAEDFQEQASQTSHHSGCSLRSS